MVFNFFLILFKVSVKKTKKCLEFVAIAWKEIDLQVSEVSTGF